MGSRQGAQLSVGLRGLRDVTSLLRVHDDDLVPVGQDALGRQLRREADAAAVGKVELLKVQLTLRLRQSLREEFGVLRARVHGVQFVMGNLNEKWKVLKLLVLN